MLEFDLSDVKPSVLNWMLIGIMAVTFIVVMKFVVNRFQNPITGFFKETINAV